VTIDAMGCQRGIAQKIVDNKAGYVLALKGNQGTLREDVEVFAAEQKANGFKDTSGAERPVRFLIKSLPFFKLLPTKR
jgi:predicted transposase YbfD/YdcC